MNAKRYIIIICLLIIATIGRAQDYRVSSPDGATQITLKVHRRTRGNNKFVRPTKKTLDIVHKRESLLKNKPLDLIIKAEGHRHRFCEAEVTSYKEVTGQTENPEIEGDRVEGVNVTYNGFVMETSIGVTLELRVYNNGVAYRYKVQRRFEEYKILNVTPVFKDERPIAILGTFDKDYQSEWNVMDISYEDKGTSIVTTTDNKPNVRGIVSWKDALSSTSVGMTFNWFTGGMWRNVGQTHSITADFTYKYLYGALTFTPGVSIFYIHYGRDYHPFDNVMGSVKAIGAGSRIGFNLPIQDGYNVWSITPYVGATLLHLYQKERTRVGSSGINPHHRYLVGPGLKIQCAVRERLTVGFSYEYQFFTDDISPYGMNSLGMAIGWEF